MREGQEEGAENEKWIKPIFYSLTLPSPVGRGGFFNKDPAHISKITTTTCEKDRKRGLRTKSGLNQYFIPSPYPLP